VSRLCHVGRQPARVGGEKQNVKWILTREAADSADDCALLTAHGVEVRAIPCVAFVDLPWPEWERDGRTPVMFLTSRRSARRYVEQVDPACLVAALSPATSEYLASASVKVDFTARGGVVPLAALLSFSWSTQGEPAWSIRYPTSSVGMGSAEQTEAMELLRKLGPVYRAPVYETRAPVGLQAELREATGASWSVTFASPSAVTTFLAALPEAPVAPEHIVCFGRSTQRAWNLHRPEHWREAVFTSNVVDTVVSLEEHHP
jgi:uroporphyrinogen-III synthase